MRYVKNKLLLKQSISEKILLWKFCFVRMINEVENFNEASQWFNFNLQSMESLKHHYCLPEMK